MIVATVVWELRTEHRLPAGVHLPLINLGDGKKTVSAEGLGNVSGVRHRHVIEQVLEAYGLNVQGGGCGFGQSSVNVLLDEDKLPYLKELLVPYELPELQIKTRPHEGNGVL